MTSDSPCCQRTRKIGPSSCRRLQVARTASRLAATAGSPCRRTATLQSRSARSQRQQQIAGRRPDGAAIAELGCGSLAMCHVFLARHTPRLALADHRLWSARRSPPRRTMPGDQIDLANAKRFDTGQATGLSSSRRADFQPIPAAGRHAGSSPPFAHRACRRPSPNPFRAVGVLASGPRNSKIASSTAFFRASRSSSIRTSAKPMPAHPAGDRAARRGVKTGHADELVGDHATQSHWILGSRAGATRQIRHRAESAQEQRRQ